MIQPWRMWLAGLSLVALATAVVLDFGLWHVTRSVTAKVASTSPHGSELRANLNGRGPLRWLFSSHGDLKRDPLRSGLVAELNGQPIANGHTPQIGRAHV